MCNLRKKRGNEINNRFFDKYSFCGNGGIERKKIEMKIEILSTIST